MLEVTVGQVILTECPLRSAKCDSGCEGLQLVVLDMSDEGFVTVLGTERGIILEGYLTEDSLQIFGVDGALKVTRIMNPGDQGCDLLAFTSVDGDLVFELNAAVPGAESRQD